MAISANILSQLLSLSFIKSSLIFTTFNWALKIPSTTTSLCSKSTIKPLKLITYVAIFAPVSY